MKRLLNLSIALFALVAISSCGGAKSFGKMDGGFGDANSAVNYTCTPEVLALTNGVVAGQLNITFAPDYFKSKIIVKVTPVMVYEGGEKEGTPFFFQGSEVEDNYTVVPEAGGSFTQEIEFPYSEEMQLSTLQLRFQLRNAAKEKNEFYYVNANTSELLSKDEDKIIAAKGAEAAELAAACGIVVAKGVNTLQNDFCFAALMDVMANDYKAVTYDKKEASIKYSINSSRVNKSSLSDAQMVAFQEFVESTKDNASATQSISANGYASPDGPEKFNDKLSSARSDAAMKAMSKFFAEMGLEADAAAYGEDWDGFKELVAASSIQDKNLILQVLSLYDSSIEREAEIKNLASVYTELKNDILPELRRAQIVNNISIQGKSDEEMMALVASKSYAELTQEELLHLAENVITEIEVKKDVLDYTAKKYNDARAYNNLGIVLAKMGDAEASLEAFEMSTRNGASDATINKNLVLANLDNNKYAEAKKYTADDKAAAAIAAIEGNYTPATTAFESYNAAIAYIMTNNYAAAKSALKCECPSNNYLRAVIAAAEGEVEAGIAYIKSAIKANPELAEKAKKDVNLANLFEGGLSL